MNTGYIHSTKETSHNNSDPSRLRQLHPACDEYRVHTLHQGDILKYIQIHHKYVTNTLQIHYKYPQLTQTGEGGRGVNIHTKQTRTFQYRVITDNSNTSSVPKFIFQPPNWTHTYGGNGVCEVSVCLHRLSFL